MHILDRRFTHTTGGVIDQEREEIILIGWCLLVWCASSYVHKLKDALMIPDRQLVVRNIENHIRFSGSS